MELNSPQFQAAGKQENKKPYRKPGVQVYGTLSELTQASPNNAPHAQDNPAPFPPFTNLPSNRT